MHEQLSYRESHKEQGEDYHLAFAEHPHRNMVWQMEQAVLTRFMRQYLSGRSARHLDFAAGTGRILAHLAPLVTESTAIDVSESMLDVARRNLPDARFIVADITRDSVLVGKKFDLITAFRFFPNAEAELRRDVLEQLVGRLNDDGYLVFNNHINNKSLLYRLSAMRRGTNVIRGMNDQDAKAICTAAGLNIVRRYPMAVMPLGETRMWFPRATLGVEKLLARIPGVAPLAQNIIYVCTKSPDR